MTFLVVVSGFFGVALVVLAPVFLLIALKDGADRRWVSRNAVAPAAGLRPGSALPRRYALFGRTVPGRDGLVVAPLSGAEGVWYRTLVISVERHTDDTRFGVLCERTAGDPFGVDDGTGIAPVSATLLQASTWTGNLSMWARTRMPVGHPGPGPAERTIDEESRQWKRPEPWLRQALDAGLVRDHQIKGASAVLVIEDVVRAGEPLHVIGEPRALGDGRIGLTLPASGRYLVLRRDPADTEKELAGESSYGAGCALWLLLAGLACLGVLAVLVMRMI